MENKLNQLALEQYATEYSDLLVKKLFENRKSISGKEVLTEISPKQVGLFVLFNLFRKWKVEMNQLKSPFFNYEDNEVKKKLEELMNLLSQNISISNEDFYPLLKASVESTLVLILSPLKYYQDLVESYEGEAPDINEVDDLRKFIKINSHMRDALLSAWASNYSGDLLFTKAFEGLTEPPEDVSELIGLFNEQLSVEVGVFWLEEESLDFDDTIEEDEQEEAEFETIHTQFSEDKKEILADSLGFDTEQATLKSLITINQKFMFVNDLFDGNSEDFNKVIAFLDTCETKDVILKFINNNYILKGNWHSESPQVKDFLALIDKKFT